MINFPAIIDQVIAEGLAPLRYGDRDSFAPGNLVQRPDGSTFVQGDLSTYRRTQVTGLPVKVDLSPSELQLVRGLPDRVDMPGLKRRQSSVNPSGGMMAGGRSGLGLRGTSQPGVIEPSVHFELVPDRTVYHDRYVERVYIGPGGQEAVFRRLRRSSQMPGNPYVRTAKEV